MEPLSATIHRRLPAPAAGSPPTDETPSGPATPCPYVRYPVELAEWERRGMLSPNMRALLALRRFADSETGVLETTTIEVAHLLHCGRSTAQKLLRAAEKRGYVHVRHVRDTVVRLMLHFGMFPSPEHIRFGLPPLRWDPGFTPPGTVTEQQNSNPQPGENSAAQPDRGLQQPSSRTAITPQRAVRITNTERTNNEPTKSELPNDNERVRVLKNEQFGNERFAAMGAVEKPKRRGPYTPVADFVPRNAAEETVKHLAALLGERYINPFLWGYKEVDLRALQEECGVALGLMRAGKLRGRPGQYVMYRLKRRKKLQA